MTTRKDESLVARCYAVCRLNISGMDSSRKAVFSAIEVDEKGRERAVYYCGIGRTDCIIAHYGQKFSEVAKMAHRALNAARGEPRFLG
jgi:hypothetical protein